MIKKMISKQKTFLNKSRISRFILLLPFILSAPFSNFNNQAKAALEFQWRRDAGYKALKYFQKNNDKRARNTIFFFLKPSDRKVGLLKINMKIPKTFNSTLNEEKISFCQVKIGGFETRTKCLKDIPADIELNEDNTSLDIFPNSPIPYDQDNKDSYAVVFKVFNPRKAGLFQFHSFGQPTGNVSTSYYLGSWTIVID